MANSVKVNALSFVLIALSVSSVQSVTPEEMSVEMLKRAYLNCETHAQGAAISVDKITKCSVIYEQLKEREFGGNWILLREWSLEGKRTPIDNSEVP